jgi:hypothetical protein
MPNEHGRRGCPFGTVFPRGFPHLLLHIIIFLLHYPSDVEASVNAIKHNKTYDKDIHILNKDVKELNT